MGLLRGKRPRTRRLRARTGRGALTAVVLLLLGSAGLRVAEHWGTARALASEVEPASPNAPAEAIRPDYDAILAALDAREALLAEREAALDMRLQAMALAERRLDEKLTELAQAEDALRATIALSETAAEDDLSQLTSVYENMGADAAAALFGQMTPEFAAGFLGRMRPDIAAGILAGLDPGTAYEISVILAGRNALAPTE